MRWLLPEYIEDILPAEAARIEALRRTILDLFAGHGYELVMPPLLEYLDSLLTGTGRDLDLRTFKLVDQLSGRMMGVRADITPQVARLDAHLLNRQGVARLCYCGSVLHARPAGLESTRGPLQIGAGSHGHAGVGSDLEIPRPLCRALGPARGAGRWVMRARSPTGVGSPRRGRASPPMAWVGGPSGEPVMLIAPAMASAGIIRVILFMQFSFALGAVFQRREPISRSSGQRRDRAADRAEAPPASTSDFPSGNDLPAHRFIA